MAFNFSYHLQPYRLPKLDARGASLGGHNYKWPSSPPKTCSRAGYPNWTLEKRQLGVTTTNGLQFLQPLTAVLVTQAKWQRCISWGWRLQMAFKLLQPLAVVPIFQVGQQRSVSWGSQLQMTFNSSNHFQPCRLPKLDNREVSVGGHDYKWPSNYSNHL